MEIIKQNPFRVLGTTGNATEKELQKQISLIKRYAEVGKSKSFDFDFDFIGGISRGTDDIQEASNRIEQGQKKLLYSLFWFVKNNQFDEIAFNNLKEMETEKAIDIWTKTLKQEISSKNYSSYLNLSTLYIALSTIGDQIELQKLQMGISLKGNLIHSEILKDFSKLVTGNGISNDPIDISKKFVDEIIVLLKPFINSKNGISTNDLISLFKTFPASIQKYISEKFTEIPISSIENNIEKTSLKRKANAGDAEEYGEELYNSTKTNVLLLEKILGKENIQFQMLANKLANEILQCSIDFFNTYINDDSDFDPIDETIKIANYAKKIESTGQVKDRIEKNYNTIVEIKYKDCFQILDILESIIEAYRELSEAKVHIAFQQFHQTIDTEKVYQVITEAVSVDVVEKIATSQIEELITNFYKKLSVLLKFSFGKNKEYLSDLKNTLAKNLPSKNKIRIDIQIGNLENEILKLEKEVEKTKSRKYYTRELNLYHKELEECKQWKIFRSSETREIQINQIEQQISKLLQQSKLKKDKELNELQESLINRNRELVIVKSQKN